MARRLLWLLPLLALPALARVGGGEHFNSGSHSSSGGSGGDGGAIAELLIWLVFRHPMIGIPLVIGVVIFHYFNQQRRADGSTRRAMERADGERNTRVSASEASTWVKTLQRTDPGFDLIKFFERVSTQFIAIQNAWFRRDLNPVRKYLSDATYQRLTVQLGLIDLQGVRDAIADPMVVDVQIAGLEQTPSFDTLHVRVTAELRDAEAPRDATDEQALALARRASSERFIEIWSFVRRPGATTRAGHELTEGKCPNCGAEFSGGAANTCEYCGAIVNSGAYDWVLAEITQGSVFERRGAEPRGFADAHQRDPSLAVEALEDRASLTFWKWIDARVRNDPSRVAKVARPEFAQAVQPQRFSDVAVGAVNLMQVMQQDGREFAAFEFRWSAGINGGTNASLRSALVLERAVGATTNADQGMSTNRCAQCNAPLTDNGQTKCEYCGNELTSGARDWVVSELLGWETWLARGNAMIGATEQYQARVPVREERERLVELLAAVAKADGVIDPSELKMLKWASTRWQVPWPRVETMLQSDLSQLHPPIARGAPEGEVLLRQLIAMAKADGKIDLRERRLINTAAMHLGLSQRVGQLLK